MLLTLPRGPGETRPRQTGRSRMGA